MHESAAGNSPPELLAFRHWDKLATPVADLLTTRLPEDERRFTWPTVVARLQACGVLIGPSAIEIRPYHPPTTTLHGYHRAGQRIYLSATLGTMDDLQRRLGVQKVTNGLTTPVTPNEVGERLFLLNPTDDAALSDRCVDFVLAQAARAGRVAGSAPATRRRTP